MSREPARNLAASVRARLLTLAQERGEDYQRILGKYAVERFLFRLGRLEHRDRYLLFGIKAQPGCPSRNLSNSMTRSRIRSSVINCRGERPANATSGDDSHPFSFGATT